jgi:hypothetical protein
MHRAASLRPVVIDESLTDIESLITGARNGLLRAAFKACKGETPQ